MNRKALIAAGLIAGVGVITAGAAWVSLGGDESEDAQVLEPSASAPITATARPTLDPTPTPTPLPTPLPSVSGDVAAYRAIFARDSAIDSRSAGGELWMSRLDGSGRKRISGEGESAALAGIAPHPSTRSEAMYFVTLDDATRRTIWAVDLATFERMKLFSFESRRDDQADAAISPDGRNIAYAHTLGIEMVDLYTGARRHLFDNGPVECDAGSCFGHSQPQWSPDGTLLAVRKTFWEGGTTVIVDPFASVLAPITNDSFDGPSSARWSPVGDQICGYGTYGGSALFFAAAPDWTFSLVPGGHELIGTYGIVAACDWVTTGQVALALNVLRADTDGDVVPEGSVEILLYDIAATTPRLVASFDQGIAIGTGPLIAIPQTTIVLTQQSITEPGQQYGTLSRPEAIDVNSGAQTPLLESGDRILAVLSP